MVFFAHVQYACIGPGAGISLNIARLKQTQADLLQAEKLASLDTLVAGIAHELNSPIGNALTTASTLEQQIDDLARMVEHEQLRRSSLQHFIEQSKGMASLVTRSCQRAERLIGSFKQAAVRQTSEQRRVFDLHVTAEYGIDVLRNSPDPAGRNIEVNIPKGIACDSYPGPLGQVIDCLVQNALIHAFKGRANGKLQISAAVNGDLVEMLFTDDGKG